MHKDVLHVQTYVLHVLPSIKMCITSMLEVPCLVSLEKLWKFACEGKEQWDGYVRRWSGANTEGCVCKVRSRLGQVFWPATV